MQSYVVDILNSKALKLLQELEGLQLIRLHQEHQQNTDIDWGAKYKGAMTKQPLTEIDQQLNELREGWE